MKKRPQKLALHRETIQVIEDRRLARAAGRGDTYEFVTGCACTDGCDTGYWCGTLWNCPPTEQIFGSCITYC